MIATNNHKLKSQEETNTMYFPVIGSFGNFEAIGLILIFIFKIDSV